MNASWGRIRDGSSHPELPTYTYRHTHKNKIKIKNQGSINRNRSKHDKIS